MSYIKYDIRTGVKKIKTKAFVAVAILGLIVGGGGLSLAIFGTANAAPTPPSPPNLIYNNIPKPQPGNVVSVSFEATGTSEFGGQVAFAGTNRSNPTITVLMSSWGCQTGHWTNDTCVTNPGAKFSVPITLNIYNVGDSNAPGTKITSLIQTFNIPYRPSANNTKCTGDNLGKWFSAPDKTCYNGFATPINFKLTNITLPNTAIISVAYNTTDYGYHPVGPSACSAAAAGCGYDSLNVGIDNALTVGTQPTTPDGAYQDTKYDSCTNGPIDPFNLDSLPGCWADGQPAFKVTAGPAKLDKQDISAKQCNTDKAKQVVDVHYTLTNDFDSSVSGDAWANDTINRHLTIWSQNATGTYCAQIADNGSNFVTFNGVSPNGTGNVSAGVKGNIEGGYVTTAFTGTLNPTPGYATNGNLGSFDLACSPSPTAGYTCNGPHPSYLSYFSSTAGDNLAQWGWIYKTPHNGTWLNQDSGNSGDITGS